jgi:hypothetical protein
MEVNEWALTFTSPYSCMACICIALLPTPWRRGRKENKRITSQKQVGFELFTMMLKISDPLLIGNVLPMFQRISLPPSWVTTSQIGPRVTYNQLARPHFSEVKSSDADKASAEPAVWGLPRLAEYRSLFWDISGWIFLIIPKTVFWIRHVSSGSNFNNSYGVGKGAITCLRCCCSAVSDEFLI